MDLIFELMGVVGCMYGGHVAIVGCRYGLCPCFFFSIPQSTFVSWTVNIAKYSVDLYEKEKQNHAKQSGA